MRCLFILALIFISNSILIDDLNTLRALINKHREKSIKINQQIEKTNAKLDKLSEEIHRLKEGDGLFKRYRLEQKLKENQQIAQKFSDLEKQKHNIDKQLHKEYAQMAYLLEEYIKYLLEQTEEARINNEMDKVKNIYWEIVQREQELEYYHKQTTNTPPPREWIEIEI